MEKVLLSKEQAEALESAKITQVDNGYDLSNIVAWKVEDLFSHDEEALNQLELDTLIRALYVGYDVEPSPEDKARTFYKSFPSGGCSRDTIEQVLGILNIHIEGINC